MSKNRKRAQKRQRLERKQQNQLKTVENYMETVEKANIGGGKVAENFDNLVENQPEMTPQPELAVENLAENVEKAEAEVDNLQRTVEKFDQKVENEDLDNDDVVPKTVIKVKNLCKSFRLPTEKATGLKQAFFNWLKGIKGYTEHKVLKEISFEVKQGEFLGIVGRNGSGKSTLLKLLAQIYHPEAGKIEVDGTLVPFIELGVGFNPELTGRENVYLNGALLGFSHKEMDAMYDEIVQFAELEQFMDAKLKNYSSGMQVRLAFSIAIRAKGDILILDEVLAVGDAEFQQKCNDYFASLQGKQTVILVTHDMNNVRRFCDRAILIEDGEILADGEPEKVAEAYENLWQRPVVSEYDALIVGAGLFGLTMAERLANELGKKVLVIDKRNHIGGNCYSEFDAETGIECHKYGAHLFHTSDEEVWDYVNKFTDFTDYVHKVYITHEDVVYPMPINLGTINQFFGKAYTPSEARAAIAEQAASAPSEPQNLAEQGISLIGKPLFDAFIKNYTAKQWQTAAEKLSPSIIKRLPVRYNYDNRYFNNTHEGLPVDGYEAWFKRMIESCGDKVEVRLETDYFTDPEIQKLRDQNILTIYTGPIDKFYDYRFGELKWRSIELEKEVLAMDDFQGCPVMNYADLDPKYTRIHEFKHFHPERHHDGYAENSGQTVIVREYSKTWTRDDEPYYPVNTAEDREKLAQYQELAAQEEQVIFGGRLGEYAYYDMDTTVAAALAKFAEVKVKFK